MRVYLDFHSRAGLSNFCESKHVHPHLTRTVIETVDGIY